MIWSKNLKDGFCKQFGHSMFRLYGFLFILILTFLFFPHSSKAQEYCPVEDSISIYIFMLEDCLITQYYTPDLNAFYKKYAPYNIEFVGLFPNSFSRPEKIDSFKTKYSIPFPLLKDHYQTRTKKFGANVTPEVVIYNHTYDEILYQGRIDNAYYRVGRKRGKTTSAELENALEAIAKGEPIEVKYTEAVGCLINLRK